jgi:hypothetical protein
MYDSGNFHKDTTTFCPAIPEFHLQAIRPWAFGRGEKMWMLIHWLLLADSCFSQADLARISPRRPYDITVSANHTDYSTSLGIFSGWLRSASPFACGVSVIRYLWQRINIICLYIHDLILEY